MRAVEPWHLLVLLFLVVVPVTAVLVVLVVLLTRPKGPTSLPSRPGQVPAGWFPDVESPGNLRYWDGTAWTEHRRPAD